MTRFSLPPYTRVTNGLRLFSARSVLLNFRGVSITARIPPTHNLSYETNSTNVNRGWHSGTRVSGKESGTRYRFLSLSVSGLINGIDVTITIPHEKPGVPRKRSCCQ